MLKSIKSSDSNRLIVTELTNKLSMGPENIIARIAIAYSISQGRKCNLSEMQDSKGKEYSSKVLFGEYEQIYIALVCQLYNIQCVNLDIPKYLKMHLDDGLERIYDQLRDNPNLTVFDFILDQVEKGLMNLNELSMTLRKKPSE